jgi:hypothetical protein
MFLFSFLVLVSMTSRHGKSLTTFSIAFMVLVFVLGNPATQTVSHSFPKVWAALQRNCGIEIGTGINRM